MGDDAYDDMWGLVSRWDRVREGALHDGLLWQDCQCFAAKLSQLLGTFLLISPNALESSLVSSGLYSFEVGPHKCREIDEEYLSSSVRLFICVRRRHIYL
jgi:hypothetical protein